MQKLLRLIDPHAWSGKALLAVVAWGASFVATRLALESFAPLEVVTARFVAGSLVLVGLARRSGVAVLAPPARKPCMLLGAILALHLVIQAVGLQYTSAINTAWIVAFMPVLIALGALILLGQHLERIGWAGVIVATLGVLAVAAKEPPQFEHASFGNLLQIGSCFTWTAYTLAAARPVAAHGALAITAGSMILSTVMLAVVVVITGPVLPATPSVVSCGALAFLGLVCSGLAFFWWLRALAEHGPARTGSYLYIEPFVTLGVGAAVLGEPVTPLALVGGVAVVVGVILVAQGSARKRNAREEKEVRAAGEGDAGSPMT
ncbi:MAG: DMT family transporter [Planctomycetota bacterium]